MMQLRENKALSFTGAINLRVDVKVTNLCLEKICCATW